MTTLKSSADISGYQPEIFRGQKAKVLRLLQECRPNWVPAFRLAGIALQYNARVKELRDAGYVIENRTERVNGIVHGAFRLLACPGEDSQQLTLIGADGRG